MDQLARQRLIRGAREPWNRRRPTKSVVEAASGLTHVVTGTGRCGTVFMARLLTSLDIPCGHELIFNHTNVGDETGRQENSMVSQHHRRFDASGNTSWEPAEQWLDASKVVADSSYLSAPYLDHPSLRAAKVIEVVRHPLSVISSIVLDAGTNLFDRPSDPTQEHIDSIIPGYLSHADTLSRSCDFYVRWSKMIRSRASSRRFIHRIEDQVTPSLLDFLDRRGAPDFFTGAINSWRRRKHDIRLKELPKTWRDDVVDIGRSLGYRMD